MKLNYACPYWGSDRYSPTEFIEKVIDSGFNGIEVFLLPDDPFSSEFGLSSNNNCVLFKLPE